MRKIRNNDHRSSLIFFGVVCCYFCLILGRYFLVFELRKKNASEIFPKPFLL